MPGPLGVTWLAGRAAGIGQQRGREEKGRWHWATAGNSKAAGTGQQWVRKRLLALGNSGEE